ncbi:hypothetical protein JCM10207_006297 [Rhodosporidiobolus poonsookiae]
MSAPQYRDSEATSEVVGNQHGVVNNLAEQYIRDPPNNLGLDDPREQDRASDLIGSQTTEPIDDTPQSAEEKRRIQQLADKLNK